MVLVRQRASENSKRSVGRYLTAPPNFRKRGPPPRDLQASSVEGFKVRYAAACLVFKNLVDLDIFASSWVNLKAL
jgi:hypothetical protein